VLLHTRSIRYVISKLWYYINTETPDLPTLEKGRKASVKEFFI